MKELLSSAEIISSKDGEIQCYPEPESVTNSEPREDRGAS